MKFIMMRENLRKSCPPTSCLDMDPKLDVKGQTLATGCGYSQ